MKELCLSTRLLWGADALDALKELRGKRVLVVADSFLSKSGMVQAVLEHLQESTVKVFDSVAGEPTLPLVAQGVACERSFGGEAVVAFGGGSAMDCAKAMLYFGGADVPLWCLPTTAGTGSEVTSFAVVSDPKTGQKHPIVDKKLLPDVALLDGRFLAGVPQNVTADTGFDVLTHVMEAFVSVSANTFTDTLAEKGFSLVIESLTDAYNGCPKAKNRMLLASSLAGMAFNGAGLGICHSLSHALGGRIHAPHGRVNALLLPHVIEWNAEVPAAAKKYGLLAKSWGLAPTPRALAGAVRRLCRRLGLPEKLAGTVDTAQVAADALADRCTADNPRPCTARELERILREVME